CFFRLRGKDLNLRPLGYEDNRIIARSFASIALVHGVSWCFVVFGRFCGRTCGRNPALNEPTKPTKSQSFRTGSESDLQLDASPLRAATDSLPPQAKDRVLPELGNHPAVLIRHFRREEERETPNLTRTIGGTVFPYSEF